MKAMKHTLLTAVFGLLLFGTHALAQDKKAAAKSKTETAKTPEKPAGEKQRIITVTTLHRNMTAQGLTMDGWKAVEKEYFDKVTMKNDLILGQDVLRHYFTADNTEILMVSVYDSWDAIEKADAKSMH